MNPRVPTVSSRVKVGAQSINGEDDPALQNQLLSITHSRAALLLVPEAGEAKSSKGEAVSPAVGQRELAVMFT